MSTTAEQLRDSNGKMEDVLAALYAYYAQNERFPCPAAGAAGTGNETFNDQGNADATDDDCDTNQGVVPWATLGLSPDDVQGDGGLMLGYVFDAAAGVGLDYCTRISGDATGTAVAGQITVQEFDGANVVTASTSPVIAALIDYGRNGAGTYSFIAGASSATQNPENDLERRNCVQANGNCTAVAGDTNTNILQGPIDLENQNYFDDIVRLITSDDIDSFCDSLVPNGGVNNFLSDNFNSGVDTTDTYNALTSGNFSGSVSGEASTASGNTSDQIAQFNVTGSAAAGLATQADFATNAVPIYISVEYRPESVGTSQIDFSVVTRADTSTGQTAPNENLFTDGITFEFARAASGATITPSIQTSGSTIATGSTLTFTDDRAYLIEVYDNGQTAWARITDTVTASNTSTVFAPDNTLTEDNTPPNSVALILNTTDAGGVTAEIDDFLIARGIGAYEPDGTGDYILNTADTGTIETAITHDFTLEAWVRPDALPTSSSEIIMSKWDSGGAASAQSFQFRLGTSNQLQLVVSDGSSSSHTFSTSHNLSAGEWAHVAVSYDGDGSSQADVQFYQNGSVRGSSLNTTNVNTMVNSGAPLIAGVLRDEAGPTTGNGFSGDMAELRLWSDVRTTNEINTEYDNRLTGTPTGLLVYWPLNVDDTNGGSVGFAGDEALGGLTTGINGTLLGNNTWIGAQNTFFFLPFAPDMCGSNATGFFECSYTSATTSTNFPDDSTHATIPNAISNMQVKVWGGGGGGHLLTSFTRNGGGGGYTSAIFQNVGGEELIIVVGGGGGANDEVTTGSSGGGKSEIEIVNTPNDIGLIAGGGGGAAGGNGDFGGGFDCSALSRSGTSPELCGDAGAGGGGTVDGQDAFEFSGSMSCGGKGASGSTGGAAGEDATYCASLSRRGTAGQNAPDGDGGDGGDSPSGGGSPGTPGSGDAANQGEGGEGGEDSTGGGGGGGGYAGGGGGVADTSVRGMGGGGGSGAIGGTGLGVGGSLNVVGGTGSAGDGYVPGNSSDSDLPSSNARGGQGGNNGGAGAVVIRW